MQERGNSTINIIRREGLYERIIASVLISPTSIRRFKLMEEDFVRLDFSVPEPIHFAIGDHIADPIFGMFEITKEQMPKYDRSTGGYDYQLQFDAPYIAWGNKMCMLTVLQGGSLIRKEASWSLTATLADHADEILRNIQALGQTYTKDVRASATNRGKVMHIDYNGISILDAIKTLAERYECEWWVTGNVIHFGKCIDETEDEVLLTMGMNVESREISENQNRFANKIWVYGSQTNMPPTYRKKLSFTYSAQAGGYKPSKDITSDMFALSASAEIGIPDNDFRSTRAYLEAAATYDITFSRVMSGLVDFVITEATGTPTMTISVKMYKEGAAETILKTLSITGTVVTRQGVTRVSFPAQEILATNEVLHYTMSDAGYLYLKITAQFSGLIYIEEQDVDYYEDATNFTPVGKALVELSPSAPSRDIECTNGKVIRFNPNGSSNADAHKLFAFVSGSAAENETLTIEDDGVYNVPTSFYSTDFDNPSSVISIGSNRLRMPEETGDYLLMDGTDERYAVERVVVFDDIFPDARLKITDVQEKNRTDYTEYDGEREKAAWQWKEYTLGVSMLDGSDFRFSYEYILPNVTLQIKFLTPEDIGADAAQYEGKCRLAGMTFDVRFNRTAGTFTIVRNSDYGTLLPNETLKPQIGDPLVIVGWNSRAISGLGLIEAAENRLLAKAQEYLAALEQGQFTFDIVMFSEFPFQLYENKALHTSDDEHLTGSDGILIYVRAEAEYANYALPVAGMPVCMHDLALSEDKHTRIIGYEYKLDKPYDSPKLTIGETDRYSRLAAIEKEISTINK